MVQISRLHVKMIGARLSMNDISVEM